MMVAAAMAHKPSALMLMPHNRTDNFSIGNSLPLARTGVARAVIHRAKSHRAFWLTGCLGRAKTFGVQSESFRAHHQAIGRCFGHRPMCFTGAQHRELWNRE
jgi:hypothetical protein